MPIAHRIDAKCDICGEDLDFQDISVGNQPYEIRVTQANTGQGFVKVACSECYNKVFLRALKESMEYVEYTRSEPSPSDSEEQLSPAEPSPVLP